MYNHTEAAVQKKLLVREALSDYPYQLADCLIVEAIKFSFATKNFEIYRVMYTMKGDVHYLDLIRDENGKFLGMGGFNQEEYNFEISRNVCQSLAVQAYTEDAF